MANRYELHSLEPGQKAYRKVEIIWTGDDWGEALNELLKIALAILYFVSASLASAALVIAIVDRVSSEIIVGGIIVPVMCFFLPDVVEKMIKLK